MISFVEWSSSNKFLDITSVSDKANTEFIFCIFLAMHLQSNYFANIYGPQCEKTCLLSLRPGHNQTSLLSYRD